MARHGYRATTLRGIAAEAGVSHAALYRHFPAKHAILLALYENLSADFVTQTPLRQGRWPGRVSAALRSSLRVLSPHRETLRELIPILLFRNEDGLFAPAMAFSRERVSALFVEAVRGATDSPPPALAEAIGRLVYVMHLGVILFWLLDQSPEARASGGLVRLLGRLLQLGSPALRVPGIPGLIRRADGIVSDGLIVRASEPVRPEA